MRDANAGVANGQQCKSPVTLQADLDPVTWPGELRRVGQQVIDHLRQARGVRINPQHLAAELSLQGDSAVSEGRTMGLKGLPHQVAQRKLSAIERDLAM